MPKTYDPRSYELAKHFLGDRDGVGDEHVVSLAREIQGTVEDFIEFNCPDPGAHQVAVQ